MSEPSKSLTELINESRRLKEEAQKILERSQKIDAELLKRLKERNDMNLSHKERRES